jgi:hypothetical protein
MLPLCFPAKLSPFLGTRPLQPSAYRIGSCPEALQAKLLISLVSINPAVKEFQGDRRRR